MRISFYNKISMFCFFCAKGQNFSKKHAVLAKREASETQTVNYRSFTTLSPLFLIDFLALRE